MSVQPAAPSRIEEEPAPALSPAAMVFVASLLGLFLELAMIRWISSEIRVFAYCKNLVLVASFLGFGAGCLVSRKPPDFARAMFLLLLVAMLGRLPWHSLDIWGPRAVSRVLADLSGFMIFSNAQEQAGGVIRSVAFAVAWTTALFFLIAMVMLPYGQAVAAGIERMRAPLRGYAWNVAGSLAGIIAYTLTCSVWLPPLCWFVPVALASALIAPSRAMRSAVLGLSLALSFVFLPNDRPEAFDIWSSYQKLTLAGRAVMVNNTGYQLIAPTEAVFRNRIEAPYRLGRPPGRVLIVGAGVGNDPAAALAAGATSVVAVEIDRVIYRIGVERHPAQPYRDQRVRVVIDDARHFLKTTSERFDLVVFSHLDSHTVLSSFTNVRLDNYIYTTEAFREARALLAEHGVLYVSFWSEQPFIAERLHRNLSLAFGHDPQDLQGALADEKGTSGWRNVCYLTGEPGTMPAIEEATRSWTGFESVRYGTSVVASTDDWPFLPLEKRQVPPIILLISAVILGLSVAFAWRLRPPGEPFDGKVFWLGAAFMLLEVHNVSRLALVFGTTWQVNAWVIGAILGMILLATALCMRLEGDPRLGRAGAIGLFLTLAAAYALPLDSLARSLPGSGGLVAIVVLTAPLFFAGILFGDAFARSPTPAFALGWNVLGAVVGGMAENLSYVFGIPALVPLAALFYVLALAWPRAELARS